MKLFDLHFGEGVAFVFVIFQRCSWLLHAKLSHIVLFGRHMMPVHVLWHLTGYKSDPRPWKWLTEACSFRREVDPNYYMRARYHSKNILVFFLNYF